MLKQQLLKHAGEAVTLILLVPLAVILGRLLWFNQPQQVPAANVAITESPISISAPVEATATVAVEIKTLKDFKKFSAPIAVEQATVAQILLEAKAAGVISLKTKDYGGTLGLFVEEIEGIENSPAAQMYWQLYLNGQRSPLGASSAIVKAGDTIQWTYEKEHAE